MEPTMTPATITIAASSLSLFRAADPLVRDRIEPAVTKSTVDLILLARH